MTVEEKRKKIEEYCNNCPDCYDCPLYIIARNREACYEDILSDEYLNEHYSILFGKDPVNRPAHYTDGKIEVIEYIEDKKLGFCLGNAIKYISRAGKKDPDKEIEDLNKAKWYIERRIKELEEGYRD